MATRLVHVVAYPCRSLPSPCQRTSQRLGYRPHHGRSHRLAVVAGTQPQRGGGRRAEAALHVECVGQRPVEKPRSRRGHGSPIVVGEQVFLATADHDLQTQSVLCYHRTTGQRLWQTEVHRGGFATTGNAKSSLASATAACDGQRVFINFLHAGAIYTTALDRDGRQLWQTKVTDYVLHQGFGSSPAVYRSLVLVSADNKGTGVLAALERATGKVVWKQERPKAPNYASPIILNVAGRDQLLMTGCDLVASFEPLTGKKFWEIEGSTTECVTSTVTDGRHIFTSGGFPKSHLAAVRADGSGKVAWQNNTRVYVPSLLVHRGYLYGVLDAGVAACWQCDTGKEMWKARLGGTFTASPVLVGDHIFATNESGRTFLFKATPEAFTLVGENQLGDEVMATRRFAEAAFISASPCLATAGARRCCIASASANKARGRTS